MTRMPIDRIRATAHRQVRDISDLVQSIREVGLLQPLVVDSDGNLLAGYHRYLALRELGWEEVPVVVELDALRAELTTLDENIVRYELTELERAEMEARRREIYEMLYPLAKRGVISNVRRGAQSKLSEVESDDVDQRETISLRYESDTLNPEVGTPPTYIQYAAGQEGVTDRTIKNSISPQYANATPELFPIVSAIVLWRVQRVRTLYVYEDPNAGISAAWWAYQVFEDVPVTAIYLGTQRPEWREYMAWIHHWKSIGIMPADVPVKTVQTNGSGDPYVVIPERALRNLLPWHVVLEDALRN